MCMCPSAAEGGGLRRHTRALSLQSVPENFSRRVPMIMSSEAATGERQPFMMVHASDVCTICPKDQYDPVAVTGRKAGPISSEPISSK